MVQFRSHSNSPRRGTIQSFDSIGKAFLTNSAPSPELNDNAATWANRFATGSTYRLPYPPLYNGPFLRCCRLHCRNFVRLVV